MITDLDETVKAIEAATERAERMAGVHISHVYVGITGEHVRSSNNRGVVAVSGEDREVISGDVRRVVDASKIIEVAADRQIIHALPRYFTVDGQEGVTDPVGMAGARLEVDTHIVTGGSSFITNVLKCVHRAGLEPAGLVFEPLASSASTLLAEEKHVGVVMLDIGGGTTDVAVFSGGGAVHTSTIPVGGNILTNDIALGLKTTHAEAERVKRAYGSRRARSRRGRRVVHRHDARRALDADGQPDAVARDRRAAAQRDLPAREGADRREGAARGRCWPRWSSPAAAPTCTGSKRRPRSSSASRSG